MKNSDYTDDRVTGWRRYIDKYLLLSWKTVLIIAGVWVLSGVLHKAMYGPFSDYFVTKDGPARNGVEAILQDGDGNLWFGTYGGGVSRYDGASWQTFTIEDGLADTYVMCILQDRDGNLWFGTDGGGVSRYDGTSWQTFTAKIDLVPNAVFILGTVLIPLYFLISLVYTVIRIIEHDQYLLLSRKTLLIIPAWVLSVVLGGVIFFLFFDGFVLAGDSAALFFVFAIFVFVIPLFFIISLVYTVIRKVVKPVRNRTS